jgi:hypothetical protein
VGGNGLGREGQRRQLFRHRRVGLDDHAKDNDDQRDTDVKCNGEDSRAFAALAVVEHAEVAEHHVLRVRIRLTANEGLRLRHVGFSPSEFVHNAALERKGLRIRLGMKIPEFRPNSIRFRYKTSQNLCNLTGTRMVP